MTTGGGGQRSLYYEYRVCRQIGLELGVVDVTRLLDLAAVLSTRPVFLLFRRSDNDPVAVRRHPDALRLVVRHVEPQSIAASSVRVLEEERAHLLLVEDVGAAAALRHERIVEHLFAAPQSVVWIQSQKLVPVCRVTISHIQVN